MTTLSRTAVIALLFAADANPATTETAPPPDLPRQLATALHHLASRRTYAWEIHNLEGSERARKDWAEPSSREIIRAIENPDAVPREPPRKVTVKRSNFPTVRGLREENGTCGVEAGFDDFPTVVAVRDAHGAAVVRAQDGTWMTRSAFYRQRRAQFAEIGRDPDSPDAVWLNCAGIALDFPPPDELLSLLLHGAANHRLEGGQILVDLDFDSAQVLIGADSRASKRDPKRFKGTARLRLAEGTLRECHVELEWETDLSPPRSRRAPASRTATQTRDLLFLIVDRSGPPLTIPAPVQQRLAEPAEH